MKKLIAMVLVLVLLLGLIGCRKNQAFKIKITVPTGNTEAFVYSDEEISATGNKITISSIEGLGGTLVILSPVKEKNETGYAATYLTPGMPVEFDAVKGEWFKIGVPIHNHSDRDKTFYVEVEGVEVRIK